MSLKILLVEDHSLVRQGLRELLTRSPGIEVVGEARDGEMAVALAQSLRPDVVVMDLGLPDICGAETARRILADGESIRVLALSAFTDERHVQEAFQAGVSGYVVKDCVVEDLVDAIRTVASGGRYVGRSISGYVLNDDDISHGDSSQTLTTREREVLSLLANGKAMKEAAHDLKISIKTVETHRRAIMAKLQLFSVAELTKHAIKAGYASLH